MKYKIPLNKMSTQDKIEAMESIWEDLCKNADSLSSPDWHKKILQNREVSLKEGNDEFVDWQDAKEDIRKNLE